MKNNITIITANAVKEMRKDDYSVDLLREIIEDNPNYDTKTIMTEYFDSSIIVFKDDKAEMAATHLIGSIKTDRLYYRNDYDDYDEESNADSVGIF